MDYWSDVLHSSDTEVKNECNGIVHPLFTVVEHAYDSVGEYCTVFS